MMCPAPHHARHRRTTAGAGTIICLGVLAGCADPYPSAPGSSTSLPTREQAFQRSEVYINQILLAMNQKPTTAFICAEGPCDETDDDHGALSLDYTAPGSLTTQQARSALNNAVGAAARLGYGTPVYQSPEESAYVTIGPFSILFGTDGRTLGISVKTCYSTPVPSMPPGLAGVMQPLAASPAPTSTAEQPVGIPDADSSSTSPAASDTGP
jgi:hypothetical protein